MIIEVFGGGFGNKGAELMLRTVVARLRLHAPELQVAVTPNSLKDYSERAKLGLLQVFPSTLMGSKWARHLANRSKIARSIANAHAKFSVSERTRRIYGLVRREECDGYLDISGYAYGDSFSFRKTLFAAERTKEYAKRGKPVIYLPQMFGPFNNAANRDAFVRCCASATLIYAREQESFRNVENIVGNDKRLLVAPDITIACQVLESDNSMPMQGRYGCIIPNEKMIDQGKEEWGNLYLDRLKIAAQTMLAEGVLPVVVLHSGDRGDLTLANDLKSSLVGAIPGGSLLDFTATDPIALKAFIAGSTLVVGSRFHSLVAALSSGVPAISMGWAHKYQYLAEDFGVPEFVHKAKDGSIALQLLVANLCDPVENQNARHVLYNRRVPMLETIEGMWENVVRELHIG
ncbi:Polysaccharide pyruvyl transferase [Planctomycetes bacterium CA13]|uniref:Polysaccharide pyruvyl transferase n=1 Tax=Novipirellula herctigrandis TaxID=2527986 RepID=A0A5C5Z9I3_9BACT|nr:Polysaccharide pyruvyl transferase [Planctomycetes bacterium CA13]